MAMDMKRVTKIPLDKVQTPFDGAKVVTKMWWVVLDGCVLLWRGWAMQCNKNREIAAKVGEKLYPGSTVQFIDVAYLPERGRD